MFKFYTVLCYYRKIICILEGETMADAKSETTFFISSDLIEKTNSICEKIIDNSEFKLNTCLILAEQWEKANVNDQARYLYMLEMIVSNDFNVKEKCMGQLKKLLGVSAGQSAEYSTKARLAFLALRQKSDLTPSQAMSLAVVYYAIFLHIPKGATYQKAAFSLKEFVEGAYYMNFYLDKWQTHVQSLDERFVLMIKQYYFAAREAANRTIGNEKESQVQTRVRDGLYAELEKSAPHVLANYRDKKYEDVLVCTDWTSALKTNGN